MPGVATVKKTDRVKEESVPGDLMTLPSATSSIPAKICFPSPETPTRHLFRTPITVTVGPNAQAFPLHLEILLTVSPFFAAAYNPSYTFKDSPSCPTASPGFETGVNLNRLSLPSVAPCDFEFFIQWLYTRTLDHEDLIGPHPAYFKLIRLYRLADQLQVTALKNAVVWFVAEVADRTNSCPTPDDTRIVWNDENGCGTSTCLTRFRYRHRPCHHASGHDNTSKSSSRGTAYPHRVGGGSSGIIKPIQQHNRSSHRHQQRSRGSSFNSDNVADTLPHSNNNNADSSSIDSEMSQPDDAEDGNSAPSSTTTEMSDSAAPPEDSDARTHSKETSCPSCCCDYCCSSSAFSPCFSSSNHTHGEASPLVHASELRHMYLHNDGIRHHRHPPNTRHLAQLQLHQHQHHHSHSHGNDETGLPGGLRELISDLFVWKNTDRLIAEHVDQWDERFLREVVVKLKREKERGEPAPWRDRAKACKRYHVHDEWAPACE